MQLLCLTVFTTASWLLLLPDAVWAFSPAHHHRYDGERASVLSYRRSPAVVMAVLKGKSSDDDFNSFAASLEDDGGSKKDSNKDSKTNKKNDVAQNEKTTNSAASAAAAGGSESSPVASSSSKAQTITSAYTAAAAAAATLPKETTTTATATKSSSSTRYAASKSSTTSGSSSSSSSTRKNASWQDDLDELLDPTTSIGRRQVLLSDLLTANAEIRASVQKALRDRKIDPLLTPMGRRVQDGTRAVARQLTNDILPNLQYGATAAGSSTTTRFAPGGSGAAAAAAARRRTSNSVGGGGSSAGLFAPPRFPPLPDPDSITKVTGRIFNALQNQVAQNLETLQGDLANPSRIPQRLGQQTDSFVKEASNIFLEKPVGLKEPPYTVIKETPAYEIREYGAYKVATTNMASADEMFSMDNLGQSGAAFNSLAAYLFGANRGNQVMEMTTPVTTTMTGEMRFYLHDALNVPDPLEQDEAKSVYETGSILIQEIPPALLAVRRFGGFCTEGEIGRQKKSLLAALQLDNIALDVAHGQVPGHVVFQYNPPYTLPVLRRNEIAVPVLDPNTVQEPNYETTTTSTTSKTTATTKTDGRKTETVPNVASSSASATTTETYTDSHSQVNGYYVDDSSPSD